MPLINRTMASVWAALGTFAIGATYEVGKDKKLFRGLLSYGFYTSVERLCLWLFRYLTLMVSES